MKRGLVFLCVLFGVAGASIAQETRVVELTDGFVFTGRATKPVTISIETGLVFYGRRLNLDVSGYWKVSYDGVSFNEIIGVVQQDNEIVMDLVTCETGARITDCPAKNVLNTGNLFQGKIANGQIEGTWTPYCGLFRGDPAAALLQFRVQMVPQSRRGVGDFVPQQLLGRSETLPGEETCQGNSPFEEIVLERIGDLAGAMTLSNRFAFGCIAGDFGQDRSVELSAAECIPFDFNDSGMPVTGLEVFDISDDSLGETDILGQ